MKRKGISPIIAAVVLIAITIAVGVMISGWMTQFVTRQTEMASSCVTNTNYKIDTATYSGSQKTMTILLTNLHSREIYDFSVQFQNGTQIAFYNYTDPDVTVSPNITKTDPLEQQRSAIIIVDLNGTGRDTSNIMYTATELKVLNEACPTFSIKTNNIVKE